MHMHRVTGRPIAAVLALISAGSVSVAFADPPATPEATPAAAAPVAVPVAPVATPAPARAPAPEPAPAPAVASTQGTSRVNIQSDPTGAEIYLDGQMVGSTPSTLMIPTGSHQFRVHASGHADWTRTVNILGGSEISLTAALDKN